jgi:hypothetical protein
MFRTVTRDNQVKPELLKEIDAGKLPDVLFPNADCSILAVTNENEGDALNEGAIHLISNFEENGAPTVRKVRFDTFTDEYLLGRDVHMPLTQKAMEYWDLYSSIATDIDWTTVRAQYNPGLFMEPEFLAFTDDGTQLFVNLQENSALLRIDVETGLARSVDGYGLKSWATSSNNEGIDIIKDDGCSELVQNDALYSVRAPDGMAVVTIDGEYYVLIAEEGDDKVRRCVFHVHLYTLTVKNLFLSSSLCMNAILRITDNTRKSVKQVNSLMETPLPRPALLPPKNFSTPQALPMAFRVISTATVRRTESHGVLMGPKFLLDPVLLTTKQILKIPSSARSSSLVVVVYPSSRSRHHMMIPLNSSGIVALNLKRKAVPLIPGPITAFKMKPLPQSVVHCGS